MTPVVAILCGHISDRHCIDYPRWHGALDVSGLCRWLEKYYVSQTTADGPSLTLRTTPRYSRSVHELGQRQGIILFSKGFHAA